MTQLRPIRDDDAPLVARYCGDRDLAWMTARIPHPYTDAMAEEFCALSQGPDARNWAITEDGGEMIGMAGSSLNGDSADVGYWIGAPYAGRGHGTRALSALIAKIFEDRAIARLTACVYQDNPASARVLVKAGFEQTADCEGESIARGPGTYPTWTFALHRAHWATPTLKTERLTLRPYHGADTDHLVELLGDIEVSRMLSPVAHPYTRPLAEEWISGALWNADDIQFAIDDGTGLIGGAGFSTGVESVPMIGFWLGRRYWGDGLMSEAVPAMTEWAFANHSFDALCSYAFVDNLGSQRIHEKAGFIAGETVEHHSAARGETIDAISYTLKRSDWQARQ